LNPQKWHFPERSCLLVREDRRIELRMGVNLGDVIAEGDDIYPGTLRQSRLRAVRIRLAAGASGIRTFSPPHDELVLLAKGGAPER
jgi:hypothetical protein